MPLTAKVSVARASIICLAIVASSVASSLAVAESEKTDQQKHPDVVDVQVMPSGENRFDFDVTVSSPYDSAKRYADAFRVMSEEGRVFGVRELLHNHANEQPFTRRLSDVDIPPEIDEVTLQARDQEHGYGGETRTIGLRGR